MEKCEVEEKSIQQDVPRDGLSPGPDNSAMKKQRNRPRIDRTEQHQERALPEIKYGEIKKTITEVKKLYTEWTIYSYDVLNFLIRSDSQNPLTFEVSALWTLVNGHIFHKSNKEKNMSLQHFILRHEFLNKYNRGKQFFLKFGMDEKSEFPENVRDLLKPTKRAIETMNDEEYKGNKTLFFFKLVLAGMSAQFKEKMESCSKSEQKKILTSCASVKDLSNRDHNNLTLLQLGIWLLDKTIVEFIRPKLGEDSFQTQICDLSRRGELNFGLYYDLNDIFDQIRDFLRILKELVENRKAYSQEVVTQEMSKILSLMNDCPYHIRTFRDMKPFKPSAYTKFLKGSNGFIHFGIAIGGALIVGFFVAPVLHLCPFLIHCPVWMHVSHGTIHYILDFGLSLSAFCMLYKFVPALNSANEIEIIEIYNWQFDYLKAQEKYIKDIFESKSQGSTQSNQNGSRLSSAYLFSPPQNDESIELTASKPQGLPRDASDQQSTSNSRTANQVSESQGIRRRKNVA